MFNTKEFIKDKILEIKKTVGSEKAVCATSGGVDSFTCLVLSHKAMSKNLVPLFIDDGLMRVQDEKEVVSAGAKLGIKIKVSRAADNFFKALKGIEEPERKRKVFRDIFYKTLGKITKKEKAKFLIQGTIAADIVETKGKIKTQHNVLEQIGIDPQIFGFSVIEPLRELYKPEVRKVAKALGLPKVVWDRMAFPGPGLALRVIGEVTPKRVEIIRKTHTIVEEELKEFFPFQAFAVLLKDKATGVVKGKRKFGEIIVVRCVDSQDAMTAKVTKIPFKVLEKIQQRITKKIPQVVKVLYDITPKPPSTIEYI